VSVPPYPPTALGSAKVILEGEVSERGQVTATHLFAGEAPFDASAADTARAWTFRPAMHGNREVASRVVMIFTFIGTTP
jgi:hypothetical protein